jgi:hypothetical protein
MNQKAEGGEEARWRERQRRKGRKKYSKGKRQVWKEEGRNLFAEK